MRQNWKRTVSGVFFLVFIPSFCPADEMPAIHSMLDRIESAYQRHDGAMLAEQLSENGFLFLGRTPDGIRFQSRQQMLDGITGSWQDLESLRIESRQVDCRQDYAILYLTTVGRFQDGRAVTQKGLALARKDPNDWKMCFAMERFFRPGLLVTDLRSLSQPQNRPASGRAISFLKLTDKCRRSRFPAMRKNTLLPTSQPC